MTKIRILGLMVCLCVGAFGGKYSREMNEHETVEGKNTVEFRIAKLNQVWEKAIRVSIMMKNNVARKSAGLFFSLWVGW